MKILLIRPFAPNMSKGGNVHPPLGLAYIAGALEAAGFSVEVFDGQAEQSSFGTEESRELLKRKMVDYKPQVVGLTCETSLFTGAVEIAKLAKEILPECKVVFGGAHVTALPEESITENEYIDFVVYGEGEETVVELCRALENGGSLADIAGVVYRQDGKIIKNNPRPLRAKVDDIDFPAYHKLPLKKYVTVISKREPLITMITSRGCPFGCKFCSSRNIHGRKVRRRSTENVIAEIKMLQERYGIKDIAFMDDTFTLDAKMVAEFCDALIDQKLNINWRCQSRVNTINMEMLKHMKRSGCYLIDYGIEFGSPRILQLSGKGITIPEAEKAITMSRKVGIGSYAFFMMGWPGETKEEVEQTIALAKEIKPDYAQFSIIVPFPGSPLYDICLDQGLIDRPDWGSFDYAYNPVIETEQLSPGDLKLLYQKAYREFYINAGYILRYLMKLNSIERIKLSFKGASSLLKFLGSYKNRQA